MYKFIKLDNSTLRPFTPKVLQIPQHHHGDILSTVEIDTAVQHRMQRLALVVVQAIGPNTRKATHLFSPTHKPPD